MKIVGSGSKVVSACALLMIFFAQPALANCVVNRRERPVDVVTDDVSTLFAEKNYLRLNALAHQYEAERTATVDGNSGLMAFYRGIAQSFSGCGKSNKTEEQWIAHRDAISAWIASSPHSTAPKLARAVHDRFCVACQGIWLFLGGGGQGVAAISQPPGVGKEAAGATGERFQEKSRLV